MNPSQAKLVQESFAKVAPISEQAAVIFYDRLFEVAPSVRAMFPIDLTEQRKKLMGTLAVVVNGLSNLESILPAASALAVRHVGYGAKPEHYPVVGGALLWTLEKGLGRSLWHALQLHDLAGLRQEAGCGVARDKPPIGPSW
jgi:hemoglobin-like flavoprotein